LPAASTTPLLTFAYFANGDLQYVTNRANERTQFSYDQAGRLTLTTSPLLEQTSFSYDDKDEVTTTIDANGYTTTYKYNWNGNLAKMTDALGHDTTWDWTPPLTVSNWNVRECDAGGSCAHYSVQNMSGALDEYIDKRGIDNTFKYDNLGRLQTAKWDVSNGLGGGTAVFTYGYDNANRIQSIIHSSEGATCTGGSTDYFTYDNLDDVKSSCSPQGTVSYTYDRIGRRQNMTVAGFPIVNYTQNDANELTTLSATGSTPVNAALAYWPDGQRKTLTVNNVTTSYSYDPNSERLSSISYASTQNPSLGSLTYSYDADGRIIGKTGTGGFAATNLPVAEGPATYTNANQIKTWNGTTPIVDQANNLKTDPSSTAAATYKWEARNLLDSLTKSSGTDSYTYDAGGRRTKVVSGGETTNYIYDGSSPAVVSAVSLITLPGSNEILSTGFVQLHDALGSTVGAVNQAGQLVSQYTYDPFGNFTVTGTANSGYGKMFGMGGIEFDPTGLYHAGARYHNPTLQRFLSEDPARQGASGSNLFAYAGNNPIGSSDPSGLNGESDCFGDCVPQGGGGGGGGGGPIGGLVELGELIAQLFDTGSPTPNHSALQLKHEFLKTAYTSGIQVTGGSNAYTQGL
jgi:RHS repeat-associated protein